ncbi:ribosome biogenesis GTP-binding protein YihA/YsxC [Fulvivirga maritima]|uniref:ribosome biogenesis GTP-binding protein YihA/YsxC n=1 Tax=Fulvivirga maritima TaxID=2904247 RepID=UPI001F00AF67|nr:ribosome biogenesis GTP-binding protein YihA/YsxC [Fulvivirga maritima]UII29323.1 ribosome biogenesis GTP-binding protein YihA/YsxC [Fulvivirga maritima]
MKIKKASFITSSSDYTQCPPAGLPEFAFIGRSNVGKSSLINMLTNHGKLAKVSGKPGKTQLINHFLINDEWYLVDLPGYGWAKVAKTEKEKWGAMIHDYLKLRENLGCIFVLIDSRLAPQPIDVEFINWLGEQQIPFALIFTKADKQSKNKTQSAIAKYKRHLRQFWEELPPTFITSSMKGEGKEELLLYLQQLISTVK